MCLNGLGLNILVLFPSLVNRLTACSIMLNRGATCITVGLCQLCEVFQMLNFHNTSQEIQNLLLTQRKAFSFWGLFAPQLCAWGLDPAGGTAPILSPPNVRYSPNLGCLDKSLQFRQLVADQ